MRVDLHKLHLVVPTAGIGQTLRKIEIQQTNSVNGVQVEIPVAAALSLLADGKGGIVNRAVLEELLVDVLHLHDKLLAAVVLAVNVEDGTARVQTVAELLGVQVSNVAHVLLAVEYGVQKTHKEFFVELRTEQTFETEISMRIDISLFHRCTIIKGGAWQIYGIFRKLQRNWGKKCSASLLAE